MARFVLSFAHDHVECEGVVVSDAPDLDDVGLLGDWRDLTETAILRVTETVEDRTG